MIADDHRLVRTALRRLLDDEPDLTVVDEASTLPELQEKLDPEACDVLLLDLRLQSAFSLDELPEIRRRYPRMRVLVLSMYPDTEYGLPAVRAGAAGYVTKDVDPSKLIRAVRRVAAGGFYASDELAAIALDTSGRSETGGLGRLTERELDVMRGIASGERVADIARRLGLSDRTVSTYRTRILEKLGCETNADIARFVYDRGLL